MDSNRLLGRRREKRIARRASKPSCECLELRTVAATSGGLAPLGQIAGQIINEASGLGVNHVQVQLINSSGRVAHKTFTNSQGLYAFNVSQPGAYTVHEVTPKGFSQVAPSFSNTTPVGSYGPGFGNGSFTYGTTNTNPANGQVGPAGWANIAPAGFEPFESPINLRGKTIDLNTVLGVNYAPAVPSKAINNSHQIQVQLPANSGDYIVAGGFAITWPSSTITTLPRTRSTARRIRWKSTS